jgi:hypothetical protein
MEGTGLRERLVSVILEWEAAYGIAPAITSALSEYDAALLLGLTDLDFRRAVGTASAVRKGYDFVWKGIRYQIKANRPSGKPGSFVTLVSKANNYGFDELIWILYDKQYKIQEAWTFLVDDYKTQFHELPRVRPIHMRKGRNLLDKMLT